MWLNGRILRMLSSKRNANSFPPRKWGYSVMPQDSWDRQVSGVSQGGDERSGNWADSHGMLGSSSRIDCGSSVLPSPPTQRRAWHTVRVQSVHAYQTEC